MKCSEILTVTVYVDVKIFRPTCVKSDATVYPLFLSHAMRQIVSMNKICKKNFRSIITSGLISRNPLISMFIILFTQS